MRETNTFGRVLWLIMGMLAIIALPFAILFCGVLYYGGASNRDDTGDDDLIPMAIICFILFVLPLAVCVACFIRYEILHARELAGPPDDPPYPPIPPYWDD